MLTGQRGSGIDRVCLDDYDIPPPSLFFCARKVWTGFLSADDRDACAILFEEEVKKVRAGYIKAAPARLTPSQALPAPPSCNEGCPPS
jgi:hypothetical protein